MNQTLNQYKALGIDTEIYEFCDKICDDLAGRFINIGQTAEINQLKVLKAMQDCRVREACFSGTTGYGYNDTGREVLEEVYASVFKCEAALVRPQITCGTHALACALFGNLRPGDELFSPVGRPYDTLEEVIGIRPSKGSLAEYGITYDEAPLLPDDGFDYDLIKKKINERTRLVTIQRSKGYSTRRSLSIQRIEELISFIRNIKNDVIIMVDNCYGEFVETKEPSEAGADIVVGSLIKNPGGGLARCGGYIAGRAEYVENAAYRLTSPGLGAEVGASLGMNRELFQGLFLAPVVAASAVKSAIFAAAVFERTGYSAFPPSSDERTDIIQSVTFEDPDALIAFCKGIQGASPVDSFVTPEPWPMPGYDSDVIMAAGAFVSGSSIELSADGPLKPPYTAYFQGGLTWPHGKFGIMRSLQELVNDGFIDKSDLKA